MLVELEKIIFDVARDVDLSNGVAPKDIYAKAVVDLSTGFPTVNIAPYDELVFGTSFAVHLSRSLATKGIELTPDNIANTLLLELRKNAPVGVDVFLGEKTFVNFSLSDSFKKLHCLELVKIDVDCYIDSIFNRLDRCLTKKLTLDLEKEFLTEISLRSDIDYAKLLSGYDGQEKQDFYINYVADDEANEVVLNREQDFSQIVQEVGVGYAAGKKLYSQSPYTYASSLKRVSNLSQQIERLMLIFPFLLLDTLKQGRVKIIYNEYIEVRNAINAIWTDKLVRERLLNRDVFDKGEVSFLRDAILWMFKLNSSLQVRFFAGRKN